MVLERISLFMIFGRRGKNRDRAIVGKLELRGEEGGEKGGGGEKEGEKEEEGKR